MATVSNASTAAAASEGDYVLLQCRTEMRESVAAGSLLPDDWAGLCPQGSGAGFAWLGAITLGPDMDIVRYWDLLQLSADAASSPVRQPAGRAGLDEVLAETWQAPPPKRTLVERIREWLREAFGDRMGQRATWIMRLLESLTLPDWAVTALLRSAAVLVVVAALYVVLNEARAGWRWRWLPRWRGRPIVPVPRGRASRPAPDWEAFRHADAAAQPALLLRAVIDTLFPSVVPVDPQAATNGELLRAVRAVHPDAAKMLHELVAWAEPVLYGGARPSPEEALRLERRARDVCATFGTA
ncbi:MAG: DUF4129 domain-containing protein [Gammaproteobacteria bacterium]